MLVLLLLAVDLDALSKNPDVAKVNRVLPGEPAIIQVLDWHYVSKEALSETEGLKGLELNAEHTKIHAGGRSRKWAPDLRCGRSDSCSARSAGSEETNLSDDY